MLLPEVLFHVLLREDLVPSPSRQAGADHDDFKGIDDEGQQHVAVLGLDLRCPNHLIDVLIL